MNMKQFRQQRDVLTVWEFTRSSVLKLARKDVQGN